jgi:hypothetical protein
MDVGLTHMGLGKIEVSVCRSCAARGAPGCDRWQQWLHHVLPCTCVTFGLDFWACLSVCITFGLNHLPYLLRTLPWYVWCAADCSVPAASSYEPPFVPRVELQEFMALPLPNFAMRLTVLGFYTRLRPD